MGCNQIKALSHDRMTDGYIFLSLSGNIKLKISMEWDCVKLVLVLGNSLISKIHWVMKYPI